MNRTTLDFVVGIGVALIVGIGLGTAWQTYSQSQTDGSMGGHMNGGTGTVHGVDPIWTVLGTILVGAVVVGVYALVREQFGSGATHDTAPSGSVPSDPPTSSDIPHPAHENGAETPVSSGPEADDSVDESSSPKVREAVLAALPEDERRVIGPVIDTPGLTQIALRDRSDFSKSKVSQTVSDLEKRGLLYRERQGRTYRVYPAGEFADDNEGANEPGDVDETGHPSDPVDPPSNADSNR